MVRCVVNCPAMKRLLLPVLLAVFVLGCKSNPYADNGPPAPLRDTLRLYENVVRWGDLTRMYGFGEVGNWQQGLENVRVTAYDVAGEPARTAADTWEQTVFLQYVRKDRQIVQRVTDHQVWRTRDDGDTWRLTTPHPEFR